jgi:uncharacterized protein (DUF433 family)
LVALGFLLILHLTLHGWQSSWPNNVLKLTRISVAFLHSVSVGGGSIYVGGRFHVHLEFCLLKDYYTRMNYADRITIASEIRGGKPCIKGTRITVYDILEYLAGGMSEDQMLSDFPSLQKDDIRATLAFAAARERQLAVSSAT